MRRRSRTLIAQAAVLVTAASAVRADDAEIWRDGEARGTISLEEVDPTDLAVLDLGEGWVPPIFRSHETFVPTFVALAQKRFSYLLRHRRVGSRALRYSRRVQVGEETMRLEVPRSGYVYVLDPPVPYEVLPGRSVGRLTRPPSRAIPVE